MLSLTSSAHTQAEDQGFQHEYCEPPTHRPLNIPARWRRTKVQSPPTSARAHISSSRVFVEKNAITGNVRRRLISSLFETNLIRQETFPFTWTFTPDSGLSYKPAPVAQLADAVGLNFTGFVSHAFTSATAWLAQTTECQRQYVASISRRHLSKCATNCRRGETRITPQMTIGLSSRQR